MKDTWTAIYDQEMELFERRYREIFFKEDVLYLYTDAEHNITHHVRIEFLKNQIFITGDYGTWVFGNMSQPASFFCGDWANIEYWESKVTAASTWGGLTERGIDDVELRKIIYGYLKDDEVSREQMETIRDELEWCEFLSAGDTAAYIEIEDALKEGGVEVEPETISGWIERCRTYSGPFIYICLLLQWVENRLETFRREDS